MKNQPSYRELLERCRHIDDLLCDDFDNEYSKHCLQILRGGVRNYMDYWQDDSLGIYCDECGHINALGHDCADWECDHNAEPQTHKSLKSEEWLP